MDPALITFIQLLLAAALGMLIGTERVAAGKRAGTRTFALTALGSCLFIITSVEVTQLYLGIVNFDPMRMAAGVVQGIGFIGAGLIILRDNALHGLTTAAGLWVSAGVGIAVGFKLYALAIFATFLTLLIFTLVWRFEEWLKRFFDKYEPMGVYRTHSDTNENGIPDEEEVRSGVYN